MTTMLCLLSAAIAGVVVWGLMLAWAKHQVTLVVGEMGAEIRFWQRKAELAADQAAQLAKDAELRAKAWRQGRDDVIAVIPLIHARSRGNEPPDRKEGTA